MHRYMLVLAALGAALATPVSAQTVKAGIEAWQRGEHSEAVAIWRPLAEAGDADAQFNLGQAYRLGRGVETNLGAAQAWLDRAARKDHLDAQATLGLLLFQNGNLQGGLRWLKMAAERGEPRALLVYGTALFNGDGVPRDPVAAYAYVSRSAAQGLSAAKDTLRQMDEVMPVDQRRKGVALAIDKAKQPQNGATDSKAAPAAMATKQQPKPHVATKTAAPASGAWRIQLGAFSQQRSADSLFNKLAAGPLAGKQKYLVRAGAVTRLQAGPFASRAEAAAACSRLKAAGQDCFAVRGP